MKSTKPYHFIVCFGVLVGCTAEPEELVVDEGEPPDESVQCDVPKLFVDRCGGPACHSNGETAAAGLDLTSPEVEQRVSGALGVNCAGIIADPADPESSLLYTKVASAPTCGARMPLGGTPLTDDELVCVRDWISGLLPPTAGGDDCEGCLCEPGLTENCYSGPIDTADIGMCASGSHTCQTSGMGWSTCEGEIVPRGENCFTAEIDENCDGTTPECSPEWALGFGNELTQTTRSVALDADGNVYALGDFEGTVSYGGDPLVATAEKGDLVVSKHDMFGNPVWSLRGGDSSNQYGEKLVIDDDGNLILLAKIYGNIDLGGGTLDTGGAGDLVVAKLDTDGQHIWSRVFGSKDPERSQRVVVDSKGDVILTGTFTSTIDFGGGLLTSNGLRDAFVVKLDGETGDYKFAVQIGGPGDEYGFGIDVEDGDDDILIGGRFEDTIEIDGPLQSAGGKDIYLAELDSFGVEKWSRSYGGPGDDELHDLKVQPNDDIVLLGAMSETLDLGGDALVSAGKRDIFIATLDGEGDHVWSARYGDELDQFADVQELNTWLTLALEPDGTIHVGGSLIGTLDFDGPSLVSYGANPDAFHLRLSADGSYLGGRRFGGSATELVLDIAVSESGEILLGGRAQGSKIDFGDSGVVHIRGDADAFVAKLSPS